VTLFTAVTDGAVVPGYKMFHALPQQRFAHRLPMTDVTEPSLSGFSSLAPQTFWVSTKPAPLAPARASRGVTVLPTQSSAASLAAATHQLLESMVGKRVPRLEKLRNQLQQHADIGTGFAQMEEAVHQLHEGMGALDFLGGRNGGDQAADFVQHGVALTTASEHLAGLAAAFTEANGVDAPVMRLLWIELVLESRSLHKRVRQGAVWLAQLDRDLRVRRTAASSDVTQRALGELSRRAQGLHERLQTVHRLCGHVRTLHGICEQLATQRGTLSATLQEKVLPARQRLHDALQPLLDAASYRTLVPEELMAAIETRHELQVALTQAGAEIIRLQASRDELASQLAAMEDKARRLFG
jgi:hypothetical protein